VLALYSPYADIFSGVVPQDAQPLVEQSDRIKSVSIVIKPARSKWRICITRVWLRGTVRLFDIASYSGAQKIDTVRVPRSPTGLKVRPLTTIFPKTVGQNTRGAETRSRIKSSLSSVHRNLGKSADPASVSCSHSDASASSTPTRSRHRPLECRRSKFDIRSRAMSPPAKHTALARRGQRTDPLEAHDRTPPVASPDVHRSKTSSNLGTQVPARRHIDPDIARGARTLVVL
jgi:hypothetical protein